MPMQYAPTRGAVVRKRGLAALGVASLTMSLALIPGAAFAAPDAPDTAVDALTNGTTLPGFQDEFVEQVSQQRIYDHVEKLSVGIGPRVAGSTSEDAAQDYVENLLKGYGFDTEREVVPFRSQNIANLTPSRDLPGIVSWQYRAATGSKITGPSAPVSAPVADLGDGSAIDDTEVDGAFAFADWSNDAGKRNAFIEAAVEKGAAGIIFAGTNPNGSIPGLTLESGVAADIPVVTAGAFQGARVREILASSGAPLTISMVTERTRDTSSNVIGVRPAVNDDGTAPIVYIGAHVDSVIGSPGASDNASGVGIMLETARIMGQYSLDTEVRVGSWGAEEGGIFGSKHHAESLSADEIARTIGAWNMDMAGTAEVGTNEQPFAFWGLTVNPDNSANRVLNYASDVHTDIKSDPLNIGYVGRSDHQSFHDVGIDAAVFSWMFWSADSSIVLEPAYHRPSDTIELVSAERMGFSAQVIGGSAFRAAMNPVTVNVTDELGAKAVGAKVAMSCGDDAGWRELPVTGDGGTAKTFAPNTSCDFAAMGTNGSIGSAMSQTVAGTTEVGIELILDETAPEVTILADRDAEPTGWYTSSPVKLTVSATDDRDKSPVIETSLDGETWDAYTAPVALKTDGVHGFKARAVDGAGNTDRAETTISIDTTAPALKATRNAKVRGELSVAASDATSGVDLVEYRVGDGEWLQFEAEASKTKGALVGRVEIGNEAVRLELRATDVAGNTGSVVPVDYAAVVEDGSGTPEVPAEPEAPADPEESTPGVDPVVPQDPSPQDPGDAKTDQELAQTGMELNPVLLLIVVALLLGGGGMAVAARRKSVVSGADVE